MAQVLPFNAPVRLPTGGFDAGRAIERARDLWERTELPMEHRQWLQAELQEGLREGHLDLAVYAVRMAHAGDPLCDAALRTIGAELQTLLVQRRKLLPGHLQIIAYLQDVALRTHKRSRGRPWHGNLVRDIRICLLVDAVCREFGVYPTRNRTERRADRAGAGRAPSGCGIVAAAIGGRYNIAEEGMQENIWGNPMMKRLRARGIIGSPKLSTDPNIMKP